MESFEPIFFFDDPSLYNNFLEPPLELEENLGSSSSNEGQTLTGDSGSNILNGSDGDDTIDGGLGVGTDSTGSTAGEVRAADEVTAYYSSDERLKENIKPLNNALDKINKINGVEFDWKKLTEKEKEN